MRAFTTIAVTIAAMFLCGSAHALNYAKLYELTYTVWAKNAKVITDTIGATVQKRNIVLFTVTNKDVPDARKKTVWLQSRVHGNEESQSDLVQGLMTYLLSTDPLADTIRDNIVFKIVPCINWDGAYKEERENANGKDLNRNWYCDANKVTEEPEIKSVHDALDELIKTQGVRPSLAIDFHSWSYDYDGGNRVDAKLAGEGYVNDQVTLIKLLTKYATWPRLNDWPAGDGVSSPQGMAHTALLRQHGLNVICSETSNGSERYDGTPLTAASLRQEGENFVKAMYHYLFHISFVNSNGQPAATYSPSRAVYLLLEDDDANAGANAADTCSATVTSSSGDREIVRLGEQGANSGVFKNGAGLPVALGSPKQGDGTLQVTPGAELTAYYVDADYSGDSTWDRAMVPSTGTQRVLKTAGEERLQFSTTCAGRGILFRYALPAILEAKPVSIILYSAAGKMIRRLVNTSAESGDHAIVWDGAGTDHRHTAPGVYTAVLRAGSFTKVLPFAVR